MSETTLDSGPSLADLSAGDRLGIKGRGTVAWLDAAGIAYPPEPNRLLVRDDGVIVARYAASEFVIAEMPDRTSGAVEQVRQALERDKPEACFGVPRVDSQAVFALSGPGVRLALSAVCPADLRASAFRPGDVLQTLCAGVGAQLWNLSRAEVERVVVLCDASIAHHQWAALQAAVQMARREAAKVPAGSGR